MERLIKSVRDLKIFIKLNFMTNEDRFMIQYHKNNVIEADIEQKEVL